MIKLVEILKLNEMIQPKESIDKIGKIIVVDAEGEVTPYYEAHPEEYNKNFIKIGREKYKIIQLIQFQNKQQQEL